MFSGFLENSKQEILNKLNELNIELNQTKELTDSRRVLLACSGGADSLALLTILHAIDVDFSVCYVEHGLNEETQQAVNYLAELCGALNIDFYEQSIHMSDAEKESNLEANARRLRYEALEEVRIKDNADVIATAHHQDDLAETFLINLIRGSGSGGVSLAKERNNIIRPVLGCRKSQLEALVEYCSLNPIIDPSNAELIFVRNRIRHEAIPLLDEISNRDVTELLVRASQIIKEDSDYIDTVAQICWPKEEASTKALRELDIVLQKHALRNWIQGMPPSSEEIERILKVVNHEIKATQISGNRTIRRSGGVLYQDITDTELKEKHD